MADLMDVDISTFVVPSSFELVEAAATVDDGQGTSRWRPERVGLSLQGAVRAASSLSASILQTALSLLVTAGDADNPPDFFRMVADAIGGGGTSVETEARAKRDMCSLVEEYLWRCEGRGGMKVSEDKLVFPANTLPASNPEADTGGHESTEEDFQSVKSPGATKRTANEREEVFNELDALAERARDEGNSGQRRLTATAAAKRSKPTYVTQRDKWNAKYDSLLQATSSLDRLKGVPVQQQFIHMYHVQQLLQELERLTRLDDSLRDARKFIINLVEGVNYSLERGQPWVTAVWLQEKLKSASEAGDMVDRAVIIKEPTAVSKISGSDTLPAAHGSAWGAHPM